jgi:hypothetical protein
MYLTHIRQDRDTYKPYSTIKFLLSGIGVQQSDPYKWLQHQYLGYVLRATLAMHADVNPKLTLENSAARVPSVPLLFYFASLFRFPDLPASRQNDHPVNLTRSVVTESYFHLPKKAEERTHEGSRNRKFSRPPVKANKDKRGCLPPKNRRLDLV